MKQIIDFLQSKRNRTIALVLTVVLVFSVTYALVLPALTATRKDFGSEQFSQSVQQMDVTVTVNAANNAFPSGTELWLAEGSLDAQAILDAVSAQTGETADQVQLVDVAFRSGEVNAFPSENICLTFTSSGITSTENVRVVRVLDDGSVQMKELLEPASRDVAELSVVLDTAELPDIETPEPAPAPEPEPEPAIEDGEDAEALEDGEEAAEVEEIEAVEEVYEEPAPVSQEPYFFHYAIVTLATGDEDQDESEPANVIEAPAEEPVPVDEVDPAGEIEPASEPSDEPGEPADVTEPTEEIAMPAQSFEPVEITAASGDVVTVAVDAPEGALPENTQVAAQLVDLEDAAVEAIADAVIGVGEVEVVHAVDITFYTEDEATGQLTPVEPVQPVSVQITSNETAAAESAEVVQLDGDNNAQLVASESSADAVVFETENVSADGSSVFSVVNVKKLVNHFLTADGESYTITVAYDADTAGIPADAELKVEEIPQNSLQWQLLYAMSEKKMESSLGHARFFDVTIVAGAQEIEPLTPVETTITYNDGIYLQDDVTLKAIHFAETESGIQPELLDVAYASGETVSEFTFQQDSFSIIGIVSGVSENRLVYQFHNGNNIVSSQYLIQGRNESLYDPGLVPEYGQTFIGWAFAPGESDSAQIYNIDQLNEKMKERIAQPYEDLDTVDVYAIFKEVYYLRYKNMDENGNVTVLRTKEVPKDGTVTERTVKLDYEFDESTRKVFRGWMTADGLTTYQTNDEVVLNGHLDLYLKVEGRYWLVFDDNDNINGSGGASYTPPQLIMGEKVTTEPANPTWKGYQFQGWYTNKNGTGSPYTFGTGLTEDVTLYAKWEAVDTNYYVIFWQQKNTDAVGLADGDKTYDYVSSERRAAKTGTTVGLTNADKQKGGTTDSDYGYYFTYNANNSDTAGVEVDPNGTTTLNVYYDRKTITINFTSTTNFTVSEVYGIADGKQVDLTLNEDGGYTYQKTTTETTTEPYSGQRYNTTTVRNNNNPTHYGVVSGRTAPVELSRRDNQRWYYGTTNNSWGTRYYDTHYVQSNTGAYGFVDGEMVALNSDGTYSKTSQVTTTEPYTGEVYTKDTTKRSLTLEGLYGSAITNWPKLPDGNVWYLSARKTNYPLPLTLFDPAAMYGTDLRTQTSADFTNNSKTYTNKIILYKMTTTGQWAYTEANKFAEAKTSTNWRPSETFAGLTIDGYQIDSTSGTWLTASPTESITINGNNKTLYLRYSRNQYKIHFISQGANVTDRVENTVTGVYYETPFSKYKQGGDSYYEPTNGRDGYYFAGWYSDEACNVPFDFTDTMPDHDVTMYAKWDTFRVRAVLVPTQDNAHNDEVQLANKQALAFRLDYKEKISDANISSEVAKRTGYNLIGWYTTPDFAPDSLWNFETPITKEVSAVNMNYQTSEDWVNNVYGDNDGKHANVRGILKLYAKWQLNVDESKMYMDYEVPDQYLTYNDLGNLQTTIPIDDTAYLMPSESSTVTTNVGEAPTKYLPGYVFSHWVLLNPDGSESAVTFAPGHPITLDEALVANYAGKEALTDDDGATATMNVVRMKAVFKEDAHNRTTTVTFEGNGGVTNDMAGRSHKTVSIPVNGNLDILEASEFTREGYDLIGWSFAPALTAEQFNELINGEVESVTAGSDTVRTSDVFQPGMTVMADNLDRLAPAYDSTLNDQDNTLYAVWGPTANTYFVKVTKAVDPATPTSEKFTFNTKVNDETDVAAYATLTAESDVTFLDANGAFQLGDTEYVHFFKVPYGATFTITEQPSASGYSVQSITATKVSTWDYKDISQAMDNGGNGATYRVTGNMELVVHNAIVEVPLKIVKVDQLGKAVTGAEFSFTDGNGDNVSAATLTSTEQDGQAVVYDGKLNIGTYTLSETLVPDGYESMGDIVVTVASTTPSAEDARAITLSATLNGTELNGGTANKLEYDASTQTYTLTVLNNAGIVLPMTGGAGTTAFYGFGAVLVAGAAVLLISKKRTAAND